MQSQYQFYTEETYSNTECFFKFSIVDYIIGYRYLCCVHIKFPIKWKLLKDGLTFKLQCVKKQEKNSEVIIDDFKITNWIYFLLIIFPKVHMFRTLT